MTVYIVGNELVEIDKMPIELIGVLSQRFPGVHFIPVDPTENFTPEAGSVIIDTVKGITSVQLFKNLDDFVLARCVSVHDYDMGLHLKLLEKMGKLKSIQILGIPMNKKKNIGKAVGALLQQIIESPLG